MPDVDHLAQIWFDGWHEAHAAIVPQALTQLRTFESFRERLRANLDAVRLAELAELAVGFAMLRGAELHQFYVAAAARGSGVASVLIADAEACLAERGVRVAWLACATGNHRAARFYEKCGWLHAGTMITPSETSRGPFPLEVWRYEKAITTATRAGA